MSWFLLVSSRIMPPGHSSDVTKDRAVLVYCILTGKSVDNRMIFQASILHAASGKSTIGLPHSSLITDLCQSARVTWDNYYGEILKAKAQIDIYYNKPTKRVGAMVAQALIGEEEPVPVRTNEPPPLPQHWTMNEIMTALEQIMESRRQQMESYWAQARAYITYIQAFMTVLAHRFSDTSFEYMSFPQPPMWLAQQNEDEDEAMDEHDDTVDGASHEL